MAAARLVLVSSRHEPARARQRNVSMTARGARRGRTRLTPLQIVVTACGAAAAILLQVAYAFAAGVTPF